MGERELYGRLLFTIFFHSVEVCFSGFWVQKKPPRQKTRGFGWFHPLGQGVLEQLEEKAQNGEIWNPNSPLPQQVLREFLVVFERFWMVLGGAFGSVWEHLEWGEGACLDCDSVVSH